MDTAENLIFDAVFEGFLKYTTSFKEVRENTILAAEELTYPNSNLVQQVKNAWCAVGVSDIELDINIEGAETVTTLGEFYYIPNLPQGAVVNWTHSDNLTYVSGQWTDTYVVSENGNGVGLIKATVSIGDCGRFKDSKEVCVTNINDLNLVYPEVADGKSGFSIFADPIPSNFDYYWTVSNANILSGQYTYHIVLSGTCNTKVTATCEVTSCGLPNSETVQFPVRCGGKGIIPGLLSVTPNPANDFIEIFLNDSDYNGNEKIHVKLYNSRSIPVYNGVTQQKKFQINTSSLQEGLYYLHVQYKDQKYSTIIIISH